jgi:hypothetical protein
MSIVRRRALALVVISALAAATGRQVGAADAAIPLPGPVKAQLDKYLGAGVVGAPVAAPPLMGADDYLPPKGTVMTYRVIERGEDPRTETHKVENTIDPQFAPGWHYVVNPVSALYLQKASDGSAVIVGEEDRDNEVLSRFSPGEPLMIAGLKPGESRKVAVNVQVASLSDPKKITHRGTLDVTYTYIGAYKVTVPAGTFDAELIRWDYRGTVGPAEIEQTDYRFIAAHAGMVAMVQNRQVSAMLFYNDKRKLGKLLQSSK